VTKQLPVVTWDSAPTGAYKLASAYADCLSEMGGLYNVECDVASRMVEERCGPMRAKLQDLAEKWGNRLRGIPSDADGPVVVFIRALAVLAVVRRGKLRFL